MKLKPSIHGVATIEAKKYWVRNPTHKLHLNPIDKLHLMRLQTRTMANAASVMEYKIKFPSNTKINGAYIGDDTDCCGILSGGMMRLRTTCGLWRKDQEDTVRDEVFGKAQKIRSLLVLTLALLYRVHSSHHAKLPLQPPILSLIGHALRAWDKQGGAKGVFL